MLDEEVFEQREGDRNIKEGRGRCSRLTGRAGDVPGVGCAGGGGGAVCFYACNNNRVNLQVGKIT